MASQITTLATVYSTVYSGVDQRNIKAPRHWPFCGELLLPVNSPYRGPATRKIFAFDDVIMFHQGKIATSWKWVMISLKTAIIDNPTKRIPKSELSLRWRHNDHAGVSNHQPPGCLLNRLFRRKSKKTSKLRVTGLCAGNSPGTGEFSAQMASYAENVSIWWRHHV